LVWLQFLLCLIVILFAGTKLARYGDAISWKTGLGRVWIGLVLLAAITSIPELVTGVSSAVLVGLPDLALGTLFGSNLFNLVILALLDTGYHYTPILSRVSLGHIISASLGILLIAVAALGVLGRETLSGLTIGWVGIPSVAILLFYLFGIGQLFRLERGQQSPPVEASPRQYERMSMRAVWFRFALSATAVIAAGIWVAFIGSEIAETTGWGTSFVGSLFLAVSSSMPELVVTFAALRLGAPDMAVADILGSNMFNMAIIFAVDLFYRQASILSSVSSDHLIIAAVAIVMTLLVIVGLRFRQKQKTFRFISWYGVALIGLYLLGFYVLFSQGIASV